MNINAVVILLLLLIFATSCGGELIRGNDSEQYVSINAIEYGYISGLFQTQNGEFGCLSLGHRLDIAGASRNPVAFGPSTGSVSLLMNRERAQWKSMHCGFSLQFITGIDENGRLRAGIDSAPIKHNNFPLWERIQAMKWKNYSTVMGETFCAVGEHRGLLCQNIFEDMLFDDKSDEYRYQYKTQVFLDQNNGPFADLIRFPNSVTTDIVAQLWFYDGDWDSVSVNVDHACGILTGGHLGCWGDNINLAVGSGQGNLAWRGVPYEITASTGWNWVQTNAFSTCARDGWQVLWCWGHYANGTLVSPTPVSSISGGKVVKYVAAAEPWILLDDGSVRSNFWPGVNIDPDGCTAILERKLSDIGIDDLMFFPLFSETDNDLVALVHFRDRNGRAGVLYQKKEQCQIIVVKTLLYGVVDAEIRFLQDDFGE